MNLGTVTGDADTVAMAQKIHKSMRDEQNKWIDELRAKGVKASHPDDGWVNRQEHSVCFCYPQFNDGAQEGDLIALGWPQWGSENPGHRIVRVVEIRKSGFGLVHHKFEAVE